MSSRRIAWQAAAYSGVHLLVALIIAARLSSYVHFGGRGLLFHALLLTGGVWAGWLALLYAIRRQRPLAGTARMTFTATAAIATSALLLLYAGAYVGNRAWGASLNYRIVLAYGALMAPNTAPLFVPWSVHISAAVAQVMLFAWYWWSWRLVARPAAALAVSVRPTLVLSTTIAWAVAITAAGVWFAQTGALGREPVAGFFFTADNEYDFTQYSLDRRMAADAVAARAAYPRGQLFTKRNVILIVIDGLRADHMGVYGYERATTPFLSSLATAGRLQKVDLALASCAESSCGITSLLTSKSFRHLSTPNFSLAGLLEDQGYDVYQLLSGDHAWAGIRKAYGTGQTLYFDSSDSKRYPPNDDGVVFEGLERMPDFAGRPGLLHFHLMSVHIAGIKHEPFRRFEPWFVRQDFESLINSNRDLVALVNNYDNGVLEADDTIRRLYEALDRKGYLANSIVVITADHGEGLGDRDPGPKGLGHVHSLHQEFVRIPILIDAPGTRYANLQFATQLDIAPTIVDTLGLPTPPSWEGQTLGNPEPRKYSFLQTVRWSPCYALVERTIASTLKYMRCGETERVYELNADPMERANLRDSIDSGTLGRLRERLEGFLSEGASN